MRNIVIDFLILPAEISDFERRYLDQINRIALIFLAIHIPAFVILAWVHDTGPVEALLLTSAVLSGPLFARHSLRNPRSVSVVCAVAAMFMGGLLVHFGQGPLQIEMHFYFFALIAMCAVFGNPMVIVASAVTVVLHHLIVWLVLPQSVFNYTAAWWVVGVHATFVALESVAACFISRSFFDNVIGLEKIVHARTEALSQAGYALTKKNLSLHAAQAALEAAHARLQDEVATRETMERELRLAQKLEGIGQLAAGIAHEINTPMQYVSDNVAFLAVAFEDILEHVDVAWAAVAGQTATSIAEARALLDASSERLKLAFVLENVPKALLDSKDGIERVSGIVQAMKSFAHVDQNEKADGDVNQAIRDTLTVAQSEYKSVAIVETELGVLPPVMCFLGRLNQVFLNLVVNAAHAIAEARPPAGGKIRITSHAENGIVTVTLSDNGAGMPAHIQQRVFEQFFTTKPVGKGTGQGLSLSRRIVVDAHGGTIAFETKLGHGTTFTIRLPVDGGRLVTLAA